MARIACFVARSVLWSCLAVGSPAALRAADAAQPEAAKAEQKKAEEKKAPAADAKPRPELSPEMAALRDRVRQTLGLYYRQSFNTRDHTAGDLVLACLPFGCQSEVVQGSERINGITCLCWNYPCSGYQLLAVSDGRIAPRVGYGWQTYPGQFLAMLALSRVPADYPLRAGEDIRTVADLVEFEKLDCRGKADQSLRLIGLSFYVPGDKSWKNRLGEDWSIDRLVDQELAQPLTDAPCGGTYRLAGLSCALTRRVGKSPLSPAMIRAQKFIHEYHDHAFKTQNPDGSWHPAFFAAVGTSNDAYGSLRSTGHVLQWLAISLPEERLEEAGVVKAVDYVSTLLGNRQPRFTPVSLGSQGVESVMYALHGLAVYDERYFRPRDPEPAAEEEKPAE